MGLRNIQFQEDYRTGQDSILDDFFKASLQEAKEYWRAVGYFRSSALEAFGGPLDEFVRNGGTIRLITSVEITKEDLTAINDGISKQEICTRRIDQIIDEEFSDGVGDGVSRLAALLEAGRLQIKIAVPKTGLGIYHEKVGVFIDGDDYVAFSGSTNESRNAFENNYECVDAYPSWSASDRAARKRRHFEILWKGHDVGADVYSFPEASLKKIIRVAKNRKLATIDVSEKLPTGGTSQAGDRKWRHQEEAVEIFLQAQRGILEMATGTGKTRIALMILHRLFDSRQIDNVIISTDGNDLLDQWYSELLDTRLQLGQEIQLYRHYGAYKDSQGFSLAPKGAVLLVSRAPLASVLHRLNNDTADRTFLIHDEVHGLGSPGNRAHLSGLSDPIRYRLGLSATPEREYDQEGNEFTTQHIGPVLMQFELKDAIRRRILAPFKYFPLVYEPTDEDGERINKVYRQKAARAREGNPMSKEEVWVAIAMVYKTSLAKLPIFSDFIKENASLLERCIVFVETMEYGEGVLREIHRHRPDFHTYFSGQDSETLKRFARGDLECLLTCHRLSEGIDIKSLNSVILFSSARSRLETIQRIGRCLRTNPDIPDKVANVVDFVRTSNGGETPTSDENRADWLDDLSQVRPED